jgi:pimeloyl-ACP methyl ester carboxylesterase
MAPHVFIEDISITYIGRAVHTFEHTDFAAKFARYHLDPRKTFYGWADIWRDPDFKRWDIRGDLLPGIQAPLLAIQGFDDECGTMAQVDEIQARVKGPCEVLKLTNCGHVVFRDQVDKVLSAVTSFIRSAQ